MSKEILLQKLRDANIVSIGNVTLRAGEIANYYIDVKESFGNPALLLYMAKEVTDALDSQTTSIAAQGYGGIPLGVVVSQLSYLPLSLVRDKVKNHGTSNIIDGYKPSNEDLVTIVDDVFTSGNSLRHTAQIIEHVGAVVLGCQIVIARNDPIDFVYPVNYLVAGAALR